MDLDRLRELAREPERTAMPKSQQFPSMTSEVLRQKQEIAALRRGLSEAIVEIESRERVPPRFLIGLKNGRGDFVKVFYPEQGENIDEGPYTGLGAFVGFEVKWFERAGRHKE